MTIRFKKGWACLNCGKPNDEATIPTLQDLDKEILPSPGDVAICLRCQHLMMYADQPGEVREPTDDEVIELAGHPEIIKTQKIISEFRRRKGWV